MQMMYGPQNMQFVETKSEVNTNVSKDLEKNLDKAEKKMEKDEKKLDAAEKKSAKSSKKHSKKDKPASDSLVQLESQDFVMPNPYGYPAFPQMSMAPYPMMYPPQMYP